MKLIDFSSKHDILIKNPDGSFSPMDEPWFQSEKIATDTWRVLSSGDYSYIIAGDKSCLAIDCGYGAGNIREYMEGVAERPVPWVANTHHHFDHTACNCYFDMAFMSKDTVPLATRPYASFEGIDFPRDYPITVLEDGDIIPLEGREIQAFLLPDHAVGSMVYLDRKERILFSGDEFMRMGKGLAGGLTSWIKNLEKLLPYRKDFDVLYAGGGLMPGETFDNFLACARYAMEHDGAPFEPQRREMRTFDGPEGHIIYDRMFPHPGDSASGDKRERPRPENMRRVEYAGTNITYDITRKEL